MADIYDARRESLDKHLNKFRQQPGQIGMACAIDGSIESVEMFEDLGVFHQFFDKLVRAYAAEVVHEHKVATMVPDKRALKDLLDQIASSRWDEYPAVGSGKELRTRIGSLNGAALDVNGRWLHMAVLRDQGRTRH